MNITHAKKETTNKESLKAIFDRQRELMIKYHDIEFKSGLMQTEDCPVNLDDKKGQARIKDFAWRITEEIGEAIDALCNSEKLHYEEELIDGLHFLTEMTILTGYNIYEKFTLEELIDESKKIFNNNISDLVFNHVRYLGMMCNCLKNKPWKQSMMKTNKENFYDHLELVWANYIAILISAGFDEESILDIYFRKSQVNQFRQRSNY
ncbi:MAG: dUTP diphosphatase [Bacilli bacterium]|nr:dUTP diphosphatase [Bacilli bacterium]